MLVYVNDTDTGALERDTHGLGPPSSSQKLNSVARVVSMGTLGGRKSAKGQGGRR